MRVFAAIIGLICAAAASAQGQGYESRTPERVFKVTPGSPTQISVAIHVPTRDFIRVMTRVTGLKPSDCIGKIRLSFDIVESPQHGQLCVRDEFGTITYIDGTPAPACLGARVKMRALYYRPLSGYVGADAFTFRIRSLVSNAITAEGAASFDLGPPVVAPDQPPDPWAPSPPGPVEPCPEMLM